ncbi:hypothetical protein [Azorhizobium doebereinerae]|uniref:hypothetical protein n=1 Tax=Azorhizobium doebereinerae TaxID=281091 RepID=UPI0012EC92CC|nr:hypothetical protein [Azorhizobium doebereinerae]
MKVGAEGADQPGPWLTAEPERGGGNAVGYAASAWTENAAGMAQNIARSPLSQKVIAAPFAAEIASSGLSVDCHILQNSEIVRGFL